MPYAWTDTSKREMHLWPHKSLPPEGFVAFIAITALLFLMPLFAVLGSVILWGLLPFLLATLGGVWWAIRKNNRDRDIHEVLTLDRDTVTLTHRDTKGREQRWEANPYWVRIACEEDGGPVKNYLTLEGGPRRVEIGAFLSEDERLALKDDLTRALTQN